MVISLSFTKFCYELDVHINGLNWGREEVDLDRLRWVLATSLILVGVMGIMPLVQHTFGFRSATITNYGPATWFPGTSTANADRFLVCTQVGSPVQLKKRTTYTNSDFFECINNWNYPVSVQLSLVNGNDGIVSLTDTTPSTIAVGSTGCLLIDSLETPNANVTRVVLYKATATTASGDRTIEAEFHFTGTVETVNPNVTPPEC
jgi:hypothetical protein